MKRFSLVLVVIACMLLMVPTAFAANQQTTGSLAGVARGYAYAGYSSINAGSSPGSGNTVIGPLAEAAVNCSLSSTTSTQSTANASQGTAVSAGSAQDVFTTTYGSSSISAQASSTTHNLNMLAGLITAGSITVVANSTGTASSATSSGGTTFSGLQVAGKSQSDTPGPNTTISLPGIGHVVLNEQVGPTNSFSLTRIGVIGIDISVTNSNLLGLGAGSRILIGVAVPSFQREARPALVSAGSYGAYSHGAANLPNTSTGTLAPAWIDCLGGSTSQQLNSFSGPTFGSTGAVNDSASGQITSTDTHASAQSNVSGLNALGGLIQGDNITVQANAGWGSSGSGSGSATTTLNNVRVNGQSQSQSPAPNTVVPLTGLGTITLNEQYVKITATGVSTAVMGMVITITQSNTLGLPVGAQIIIGYAGASAIA